MNFISAFDLHFEQALYAIRDPSLVKFFSWVSALGSHYAIFGLTFVVAIALAYRNRWLLASGLFAGVFGSAIVAYVLKEMIQRPRPPDFLQAYTATTFYSFPSIHATLSVAFYVFILWLIYGTLSPTRKYLTIAAVAILIIAIGFSRLYLGVHYPSDVLAGYVLGGVFVLLGIKVAKYFERKVTSVS
ncbi:MAG: phosphatase PAP2 family protein [bacterium]|nr:phosphatase PAP2 family protein [bacterium]